MKYDSAFERDIDILSREKEKECFRVEIKEESKTKEHNVWLRNIEQEHWIDFKWWVWIRIES